MNLCVKFLKSMTFLLFLITLSLNKNVFGETIMWLNEESITTIQRSPTISKPTLMKVFKDLKDCIFKYFERNPSKLGGLNVV